MELPALLPEKYYFISKAENDQALFQLLLGNTADFVNFFEVASEDETWSEFHQNFMSLALAWFTNQFFQDKLDLSLAVRIRNAFQEHYPILHTLLPKNISLQIKGELFPVNSLILGSYSLYLKDLILKECRDKSKKTLTLANISESEVNYLIDYMDTGKFKDLWRFEKKELISLLKVASKLQLYELSKECQLILKRYLSRENVVDTLTEAINRHWIYLKEEACLFFNHLELGANLYSFENKDLGFEFFTFLDKTWEVFLRLAPKITHLIVKGKLSLEMRFDEALKKCPNLSGLDLSATELESPFLNSIPGNLRELNVGRCQWLTDENFFNLNRVCPNLQQLDLSQDTQLTYKAFGSLKKFGSLKSLTLSYCHQIGDEELALVLESCPGLIELNISGCKKLTESALLNTTTSLPRLITLSAERTGINDRVLNEIGNKLIFLEKLDLTHCLNITDRGVGDLLRKTKSLKELNLRECRLSSDTLKLFKDQFPKILLLS